MKILITGATGFIGRHLFLKLKELGHKVESISLKRGIIGGQKVAALNLKNKDKLRHFFRNKNFDIIVHLAAKIPRSMYDEEAQKSLKENFYSTLNLLEEFNKNKAKKFIYASSMSVVGRPQYFPVDEKHPLNPNNFYSIGKLLGEMLCKQFRVQTKKTVVILRISAPYGPGQNENYVIPLFIKRALTSQNILIHGTGKRAQDFVFITDVVDAFLAAIQHNHSGIYNIGSGQAISIISLARTILKNVSKTTSKIVFTGQKDPQENYKMRVDIRKARRDLKYSPKISINEGIKKYINYFISQRK